MWLDVVRLLDCHGGRFAPYIVECRVDAATYIDSFCKETKSLITVAIDNASDHISSLFQSMIPERENEHDEDS